MADAGVGASPIRPDARAKAVGAFPFADDLRAAGSLEGVTVRSPHPAARIVAIDTTAARAVPGVVAVVTAADVPGRPTFGLEFADQPVLAIDRVRYVGEPVALVAGVDAASARAGARAVAVHYEVTTPVTDPVAALREDAARVHDDGNLLRHLVVRRGSVGDVQCDPSVVWVEGYYETACQDQVFLGPEAGLARPTGDGGVELDVATQWLHADRDQVAAALGLDPSLVRLRLAGVAGAFGGREDVSLQIHCCLLALAAGAPVRMAYTRTESFLGHPHRHPARIWMRHAARPNGTLVAVIGRMVLDAGAYASSSAAVTLNAATFLAGPYAIPAVDLAVTTVFTDNPPNGAMRGFGAPQACLAHEGQLDRLARALAMDPVELRRRNLVRAGSTLSTGQVVPAPAPVEELLARCRDAPIPEEAPASGPGPLLRRGTGVAVGYKNLAFSAGFDDATEVEVSFAMDGPTPVATVRTAAVDVGQGLDAIVRQVVRDELAVDRVEVLGADTSIGSAGSASASRLTMMVAGALQRACADVRAALAADPGARAVRARATYRHRATSALDDDGQGEPHAAFAFVAQRAVVEVDLELGTVQVLQVVSAHDVGRVLHPAAARGQVTGGTMQGIGLALLEDLAVEGGQPLATTLARYLVPTAADAPDVEVCFVEQPDPALPLGARGIGELATVVSTAAVVAALRDATGRELTRVPVRPEAVLGLVAPADPPWPLVDGLAVGVAPWLERLRRS